MLHLDDAKRALHVDVAVSNAMQAAIDKWALMFQEKADWLGSNTQSLGLSAAIAGEMARLTTVEMDSTIEGSPRADYLQKEYQVVLDTLRTNVELAAAGGGMIFKPYLDGGHIAVDCVPAWRFLPTAFNSRGEVTGAVFVEQVTKGKTYYTRMEHHQLTNSGYSIKNMAFTSPTEASIGMQCSLDAVDEWADLEPELTVKCKDGTAPDGVLFAQFKMPFANTIDPASPLGVSVYSRAEGLIEQADKQYSRILWEYEGSELAVDASEGALKTSNIEGKPAKVPERRKRLFRELGIDQGTGGDLYKVFSPAIRDTSLFNGLDKILKRIEFNCYLSYGTLSDPQSVEKTAEEIKTSKQRSYSAVCDIQKSLQGALEHLVWVMDLYTTLYNLAPRGEYEVGFSWGDGVMENTDTEYARRADLADRGYLKPEKLVAWYFGISEEEARKDYLPPPAPPMFEGE
ncbi:MAG: phage capsid protein [Oscillospiraceae bacterium]